MGELFQPTHLLLIAIVALILFGPRRLPELGKGLGEGIRALKEGMKDQSANQAANPPAANPPAANPPATTPPASSASTDATKGPESKS